MKRIRYLTLLMLLVGSISSRAQDGFNPDSPAEPGLPPMKLEIAVTPSEAGSVSGAGRYAEGTKVSLSAYTNTGFRFVKWVNAKGETVSASTSFVYTKGAGHERLTAYYEFDPTSPADPAEPSTIMYYQLQLKTTEGGSASGGGLYLAGKSVTLYAYPDSQFDFDGWYDEDGLRQSTSRNYSYTTTAKHRILEARFTFNPDSPNDPSEPTLKPKHNIYVTANEGGTVNTSMERLQEGAAVTLRANLNSGYIFAGWYLNGVLYTTVPVFSYTVTTEKVQNFEARFEFSPDSPSEPSMPTTTKHAFFLMNKVTKPGTTVQYPIYLSNVRTLKDMTFQLSFPKVLLPQLESVQMSERASDYEVSYSLGETTDDEQNYVLSLIGGEVPAGNAAVLVFTINVPDDIATAQNYQMKINQVSVTEEDGSTVTASTRNGRISVYKRGDTNGDDVVNIVDVTSTISHVLGNTPKVFIEEIADANSDNTVNIVDVTSIIDIVLDK